MARGLSSSRKLRLPRIHDLACVPSMLFDSCQHLEVLRIWGCSNLTDIRFPKDNEQSMQSLMELTIAGCKSLKSVGYTSGRLQGLASLQLLDIEGCPNLASFTVDWTRMQHLYDVNILKCPNWRSLPQDISVLASLNFLSIGFSLDDFDMLKQTLHYIRGLTSLRGLTLYGFEEWDSVPNQLQHLTNLTSISLYFFGVEVLPEWFGNISSLEKLILFQCRKLRQLPSKEVMQRLTKFKKLHIDKCPLLKDQGNFSINNGQLSSLF